MYIEKAKMGGIYDSYYSPHDLMGMYATCCNLLVAMLMYYGIHRTRCQRGQHGNQVDHGIQSMLSACPGSVLPDGSPYMAHFDARLSAGNLNDQYERGSNHSDCGRRRNWFRTVLRGHHLQRDRHYNS